MLLVNQRMSCLVCAVRGLHALHHNNPSSVELVDHVFGGDSDRTDEKGGLLFDDDVRELRQLAFGIVVLMDQNKWMAQVTGRF